MSEYTLYNTYVTHWSKLLIVLDGILTKAEAHAKENSIDVDAEYADAKLYEDMLPLVFQIQAVTSQIKLALSLLTDNSPEWERDEKTFADLHARIKKTQDYVSGVKPEDINGREDEILKPGGWLLDRFPDGLPVKDLVQNLVNPNVYFHVAIAYGILRKQGVPLGKQDYLSIFLEK